MTVFKKMLAGIDVLEGKRIAPGMPARGGDGWGCQGGWISHSSRVRGDHHSCAHSALGA